MVTYLVTGAGGFVGSNLVRSLLDRGHVVRGIDNFETGRRSNLADVLGESEFTFVEGDIRNTDDIESAIDGVDYVLHQAAVPSVPRSIDNPQLVTETNCSGTANVLVAARDASVEKVVVASSSSVYGPGGEGPTNEDTPIDPVSPYALSKFWTERLTLQFARYYDIETIALRYFNVFGPYQDPEGNYAAVVPKFIGLMLDGDRPVIYGDGEQSRDFTYIDNIIEANVRAAESDCSGEVFNVGCGDNTSINELVDHLNEILQTEIDPQYDDPRPGDVRHSEANIEKATRLLGYEPQVSIRDGLKRTVDYFSGDR